MAPAASGTARAAPSLQQPDRREHEHPDDVDEVPEQRDAAGPGRHVVLVASAGGAHEEQGHRGHTDRDVHAVQARSGGRRRCRTGGCRRRSRAPAYSASWLARNAAPRPIVTSSQRRIAGAPPGRSPARSLATSVNDEATRTRVAARARADVELDALRRPGLVVRAQQEVGGEERGEQHHVRGEEHDDAELRRAPRRRGPGADPRFLLGGRHEVRHPTLSSAPRDARPAVLTVPAPESSRATRVPALTDGDVSRRSLAEPPTGVGTCLSVVGKVIVSSLERYRRRRRSSGPKMPSSSPAVSRPWRIKTCWSALTSRS